MRPISPIELVRAHPAGGRTVVGQPALAAEPAKRLSQPHDAPESSNDSHRHGVLLPKLPSAQKLGRGIPSNAALSPQRKHPMLRVELVDDLSCGRQSDAEISDRYGKGDRIGSARALHVDVAFFDAEKDRLGKHGNAHRPPISAPPRTFERMDRFGRKSNLISGNGSFTYLSVGPASAAGRFA